MDAWSKVHGANMGPTWVLSAPDGPHVGPMNLAIRDSVHDMLLIISWFRCMNCVETWISAGCFTPKDRIASVKLPRCPTDTLLHWNPIIISMIVKTLCHVLLLLHVSAHCLVLVEVCVRAHSIENMLWLILRHYHRFVYIHIYGYIYTLLIEHGSKQWKITENSLSDMVSLLLFEFSVFMELYNSVVGARENITFRNYQSPYRGSHDVLG